MHDYPSILAQPGSAARNLQPIIEVLGPLISDIIAFSSSSSSSLSSSRPQLLELASYPYEHIVAFAKKWGDCDWWGTARDDFEVSTINGRLSPNWRGIPNLRPVRQLDIGEEADWQAIRGAITGRLPGERPPAYSGVIMLNLVHCCPSDLPPHIFRELSPLSENGRALLDSEKGWIAAYGAFKNDDGSYKTKADEEFDRTYIKSKHESLGLRTIQSISALADRWGFVEESRSDLPKGNVWVVWRVKYRT